MDFFKSFFGPTCTKAPPPWSTNELHVAYYGPKSEMLYEEQDSEIPPIAGDECYRVSISIPGRSVALPEPEESGRCIVGLRVKSRESLKHAHLIVGSTVIATTYENDSVFSPTVLPIPAHHKIEVVADEDTESFEVSYVVRKLQNPSNHYRFWYDREVRKFVDGRLFLNGPISKLRFIGRKQQVLYVNGRPILFEGETLSFEPITIDFDEIEVATISTATPPLEMRATQLNLIEIKDGMLNLPFKR